MVSWNTMRDEIFSAFSKYGKPNNFVNLMNEIEDKPIEKKVLNSIHSILKEYGYKYASDLVNSYLNGNLIDLLHKFNSGESELAEIYLFVGDTNLDKLNIYGKYSEDVLESLLSTYRHFGRDEYDGLKSLFEDNSVFNLITRSVKPYKAIEFISSLFQHFGYETAKAYSDVMSNNMIYLYSKIGDLPFYTNCNDCADLIRDYGALNPRYSKKIVENLTKVLHNPKLMESLVKLYRDSYMAISSVEELSYEHALVVLDELFMINSIFDEDKKRDLINEMNNYLGNPRRIIKMIDTEIESYNFPTHENPAVEKALYSSILGGFYGEFEKVIKNFDQKSMDEHFVNTLLIATKYFGEEAVNLSKLLSKEFKIVVDSGLFDDLLFYTKLKGMSLNNIVSLFNKYDGNYVSLMDTLILNYAILEDTVEFFDDEKTVDLINKINNPDAVLNFGTILSSVGLQYATEIRDKLIKTKEKQAELYLWALKDVAFNLRDGVKLSMYLSV